MGKLHHIFDQHLQNMYILNKLNEVPGESTERDKGNKYEVLRQHYIMSVGARSLRVQPLL